MNKRQLLSDTIAILMMILFLYTGISKLTEYQVFKQQLADSPFLSSLAPFMALSLPVIEIIVVVLLILPAWRLLGLYISTGLLLAFTAYIIIILNIDKELPCSCGGVLAQLSWPQHLVLNGVFILLAIIGIGIEKKQKLLTIKSNNA